MEENIFDAMPGFDRLLEQKPFEALSIREREQVLQFISAEDYNRFRECVLIAQSGKPRRESLIAPDPSVKSRLLQTFVSDDKPPAKSTAPSFPGFLNYRIPVYQAGIAASVLLFLVFYLLLQNYRMPVRMAVADTVYVDRPVLLKDTVWLEKSLVNSPETANVRHPHTRTRDIPSTPTVNGNQLYARQMQDAMDRMSVISGLGKDKSVNHDAGLMKLVAVGVTHTTSP
jgi:hypothetical protein